MKPIVIGISGAAGSGKDTTARLIRDYAEQNFEINSIIYPFARTLKDMLKSLFYWDHRHVEGELKQMEILTYPVTREDIYRVFDDYFPNAEDQEPCRDLILDAYVDRFIQVFSEYETSGIWSWVKRVVNMGSGSDTQYEYCLTPRRAMQLLGTEVVRHMNKDKWVSIVEDLIMSSHGDNPPIILIPDVRMANEAALCREHGFIICIVRKQDYTEVGLTEKEAAHSSENSFVHDPSDLILYNDGDLNELRNKASTLVIQKLVAHRTTIIGKRKRHELEY